MPANTKKLDNTTKHWTNAEKERRAKAEMELERKFVRLTAPRAVKENNVAFAYWKSTINQMKGITLLDNADTELLASYCLAKSRADVLRGDYEEDRAATKMTVTETLQKTIDGEYADQDYPAKVIRACMANELSVLKALQAQERLIISYAKELGLTPAGRQRLAKKKAEERPVTEADLLYGD